MADQKITALTQGTPANTDVIPYVDLVSGTTKKALKSDLKGDAATIAVGTVTTGAAGSDVEVENSGTTSAAVFDFTIPRGNTGAAGADGAESFTYIAYASDDSGTGFTMTFNASLDYIAIKTTTTEIVTPQASDFTGLWKNYKGATGSTGATGPVGLIWEGAWLTATAYALNDAVEEAGSSYICIEAHTSGTFSTDLAAGKWQLMAEKGADGSGSGDVHKVGTPVDNQIGVWTGDGTIEGSAKLTFTGDIATITNTVDAASNRVLVLQGDRATPAANDEIYQSFFLSDSAGNQDEMGRITLQATDVTSTSEDSRYKFFVRIAGTLTQVLNLEGTTLRPNTNDAVALGTGATSYSDLFLASGGVINFADGNAVLTHSSGILTVSTGDLRVTTAGTNAASAVTNAGTQTLTNKRITKRTGTTTSSATPTINTDDVDEYYITAQAADITSFTTNLSGTPTLGQTLFISVIGTAARAITWGASFANGPVALPTTTVTTTQLSVLLKWDGSIWRCYATGSTV